MAVPKWQRVGFPCQNTFKAACAATNKTKTASKMATKTKLTQRAIFFAMWERADFHQAEVTVTMQQIMQDCGCSLPTVKKAWRALKEEFSIRAIRNSLGGRGLPVTFRLMVSGQAGTPIGKLTKELKEEQYWAFRWKFLTQKHGPIKALSIMEKERAE